VREAGGYSDAEIGVDLMRKAFDPKGGPLTELAQEKGERDVGRATNTIFPWTVSDFGLTDAIESGLVKIPQLAVRDNTGAEIPGYFNIWHWILPKLTAAERGGRKSSPKPEAILKYAYQPIAMLGALWDDLRKEWKEH
jgi:type III restriction enzyme